MGIGVVVVLLVAAGAATLQLAGDDDDDSVTVAPDDISPDVLDSALLTGEEVGDDFTEMSRGERAADDSGQPDELPEECRRTLERVGGDGRDEGREATFSRPGENAELTHTLSFVRADDPGFSEVQAGLEPCTGMELPAPEGGTVTLDFTAEPLSGLGEDALAISMTGTSPAEEGTYEQYGIVVAHGGVYSQVSLHSATRQDAQGRVVNEPVDHDLVRRVAEAADEKIQQGIS